MLDLSFLPAAVQAVQAKFFLDVGARQRLMGAAAQMRLPLFDDLPVLQPRAHVAGELVRVEILRIDLVADLRRERADALVAHALLGERLEPGMAEDETR